MSHEVTVGLEIHQQLNTRKLFCNCPSCLVEEEGATFQRRLRPIQSEEGKIDRAALDQAERKMQFRYQSPSSASCLVEADEEPPHDASSEAIDVALTVAALLGAKPLDEIYFMRKLVIDGSNTTGFQRTAMIALDGFLEVNGRRISIDTLCLEEDAARKVETDGSEITYRLDRLGIPLIEIATAPDMHSPEEVKEVAQRIGSIMRATRKVKRGIGTIREDVNISIPGGARVEIKGVQELRMLPTYVEKEMERQQSLLAIRDILSGRGIEPVAIEVTDLTYLFEGCKSKVITSALKSGGKVMVSRLPGFTGVLRSEDGKLRLGAEMAQYARTKGVRGIFHSDELPAYGIEKQYVDAIRDALKLGPQDAFALCAASAAKAREALKTAVERANGALVGVPEETRDPLPDGSSVYSRPLPGADRMHPETDVLPISVPTDRMENILSNLPELPEIRIERIANDYGIHIQQSTQLVREGWDDVFEEIATDNELAALAARTLTSTLSELEREIDISQLNENILKAAFAGVSSGTFAKEAVPDVLRKMAEGMNIDEAVSELGLSAMSADEAREIVARVIREREDFVREKGKAAIGPLMGPVMAELRGRLDGKAANELLREELQKLLS
ncbi:MAG: Glu-tRNA(Gln) amidotransferase subunit GatE [Euryarchaeota archaeon]|nr:Glu-tRNA(Gln) amidotransferase subunit GatE [Euryarchaeota archaeon]